MEWTETLSSLIKSLLAGFAIYAIYTIERDAIKAGMNGKALALAMAAIAGLGGVIIGNLLRM